MADEEVMTKAEATAALAKRPMADDMQMAVLAPDARERFTIMQEALEGEQLSMSDFEVVKVPTGGGKFWEVPDGPPVQEVEGVVVARQTNRAYWKGRYGDDNKVPDCVSRDSVEGIGDNGQGPGEHDCATCPQAQFGTATRDDGSAGDGQACRLISRIFMYPKGSDSMLPLIFSLAPTSRKAVKKHFVGSLGARGIEPHTETVIVGLEQDTAKTGQKFSRATFKRGARLSPEAVAGIKMIRSEILPVIEAVSGRILEGELEQKED